MVSLTSLCFALVCGILGSSRRTAAFGNDGPVPSFLQVETREHPVQVENHDWPRYMARQFGKGKSQAFVALLTQECIGTDVEAYQKGLLWDIKGLHADRDLSSTVVGTYSCFHEDYDSLCRLMFGEDINSEGCTFYVVPAEGDVRKLAPETTPSEGNLKAFIVNSDESLSTTVPSGTLSRLEWSAQMIILDNLHHDVQYLLAHPIFPAGVFIAGTLFGVIVNCLLCGGGGGAGSKKPASHKKKK